MLGEVNVISDTYVAEDWGIITCDRKNRNQIAKYGGNFSSLQLSEGKAVNKKIITRMNVLGMQNTYCESEGAAVARNHLQENVMVASNDADALFYCVIAANKRDRVSNEFSHKFWLELLHTSIATGLTSSKNNRVSEYWNINELIYSIEHLLPNIVNPVLSLIVLYLSAGSDTTGKWFGKTHATFLKKYADQIRITTLTQQKFHSMNYESKSKKEKI